MPLHGTWQATGGGSSGRALLFITGAMILLGSGVGAAIATAVVIIFIAIGGGVVLAVIGLTAFLIWRTRRGPEGASSRRGIVPAPVVHQLPGGERAAIPQHLHLHLHFDGADPAAVAEILRRHQAE